MENESLINYIARFEDSYADVQKTGENLSSTCRAIFLLRQANLTDVDLQIITANLEFDPISPTASMHYDKCKANMVKFHHNKVVNNQVFRRTQSAMAALLACLEDRENLDQECADHIKTFLSTASAQQGGRDRGGKQGGRRGGHAGNMIARPSRFWKCDYCLCDCYPKWEPCECACSSHDKEGCPKPNPTKVKAYGKGKAERV